MSPSRKVFLETLGCSKNLVDSEALAGLLGEEGLALTEDASEADLLLLNTCGFIEDARRQSIERILELGQLKEETGARLAVFGCLSQRYAGELRAEMPEIDLLAGVGRQESLAPALRRLLEGEDPDRGLASAPPATSFAGFRGRPLFTPPHLAYVKVGEGCSRGCSFCAIPAIRGPFRSRAPEEILAEVRVLAEGGVGEINLISQDTAYYGRDREDADLPGLVRELGQVDGLRWIRLHYFHPALVQAGELLRLFELPKVAPYLDIPVQHASDALLRAMRRGHDRASLEGLMAALRRERPDLSLRSTVLVGHPGETEEDLDILLDFLEAHPFDKLGVFGFSPEEGTAAAALVGALEPEEIAERVERVQLFQMPISEERSALLVGKRLPAVVEAVEGKGENLPPSLELGRLESSPWRGARMVLRTERDAYEVDGNLFCDEENREPGDWVEVEVTESEVYDLRGRVLGPLPSP